MISAEASNWLDCPPTARIRLSPGRTTALPAPRFPESRLPTVDHVLVAGSKIRMTLFGPATGSYTSTVWDLVLLSTCPPKMSVRPSPISTLVGYHRAIVSGGSEVHV